MASPARTAPGPSDRSMTDEATAQGAEVAEHARDSAAELKDNALDRAGTVSQEAMDQARDLVSEAREQLDRHASGQAQQLGASLRRLAEGLEDMCQRGETGGPASRLVSEAADLSHQAADFFDGRQVGEIVDDIRSFARRRPAGFLIGAAALGIAVGRLGRGVRDARQPDEPTYPQLEAAPAAPTRVPVDNELRTVTETRSRKPSQRATATGAATGATSGRRTAASRTRTAKPAAATRSTASRSRRTAPEPYPTETAALPTTSRTRGASTRGGRR